MLTDQSANTAQNDIDRRAFISTATKAAGALLLTAPLINFAAYQPGIVTVGQVMDLFISEVQGVPVATTVDTLKAGNRDTKVTGIVTSMFATLEVIRKAIALKANFIIAHEPTFYNHADDTGWLENNEVYRYKANLLKKNNIAVWRNHDYIHQHKPDGVMTALVAQLGWTKNFDAAKTVATLPAVPLKTLIQQLKQRLGIAMVRYIGDLAQPCKKVLLMPGASGGKYQIESLNQHQPDVLICGEIQEWETAEYVRDARANGQKVALVVLGHIPSEEAGSEYMKNWLKQKLPTIKTTHIPAKNPLSFL